MQRQIKKKDLRPQTINTIKHTCDRWHSGHLTVRTLRASMANPMCTCFSDGGERPATCILNASRIIVRNPSIHLHHVPWHVRAVAPQTGGRCHGHRSPFPAGCRPSGLKPINTLTGPHTRQRWCRNTIRNPFIRLQYIGRPERRQHGHVT